MGAETIQPIAIDPDLAQGLEAADASRAERECVAPVLELRRGSWNPGSPLDVGAGGFGVLLLSGYLVRRVGQGGRSGAELLGPGDLLRPWHTVGRQASIPFEPCWHAVSDARLAVLDEEFARLAAPYPAIAAGLVDRAMLRSRHLAINLAIVQQPRVDVRLHMVLWHLADRWGKTGAAGVTLDAPLTQGLLAELVAARRPTVSTAIGRLIREHRIERRSNGWLLRGGPPLELTELSTASGMLASHATDDREAPRRPRCPASS